MSVGNKVANVQKEACWLVSGSFHLALLDGNDKLLTALEPVGSLSEITFSPEVQKIQRKEFMSGKNNVVCENTISTDISLSLVFEDITLENMSKFMSATVKNTAASTAFGEVIEAKVGKTTKLNKIVSSATPVVVSDGSGLITFEEGLNYEISSGSIYIYSVEEQTLNGAATNIENGLSLEITYDSVEFNTLEAFTTSNLKFAAYFEGVNMANGKAITFEIPKISIEPSEFNFLAAEEYANVSVSGSVLLAKGKNYLYDVRIEK